MIRNIRSFLVPVLSKSLMGIPTIDFYQGHAYLYKNLICESFRCLRNSQFINKEINFVFIRAFPDEENITNPGVFRILPIGVSPNCPYYRNWNCNAEAAFWDVLRV